MDQTDDLIEDQIVELGDAKQVTHGTHGPLLESSLPPVYGMPE